MFSVRVPTIPVVLPERITKDKELQEVFKRYAKKKKLYVITHFNHPRELTDQATAALKTLTEAGVRLHNQTVLMKGVNDNVDTLAKLFNGLIDRDDLPYYMFQCRPVSRVKKHFAVPIYNGIDIFYSLMRGLVKNDILCKRIKYIMSHKTGKIEIIGKLDNRFIFRYHRGKDQRSEEK